MNPTISKTLRPREKAQTPFERMMSLNRQELFVYFARPLGPSNSRAWNYKIVEDVS